MADGFEATDHGTLTMPPTFTINFLCMRLVSMNVVPVEGVR